MRQRENNTKLNSFRFSAPLKNITTFNKPVFQPRPVVTQTQMPFAAMNFGNNTVEQKTDFKNYKPTPMSISTKNTTRQGSNHLNGLFNTTPNSRQNSPFLPQNSNLTPRGNNFFRSTGPPNFVSEELHYQEEEQDDLNNQDEIIYPNIDESNEENFEITNEENFHQEHYSTEST